MTSPRVRLFTVGLVLIGALGISSQLAISNKLGPSPSESTGTDVTLRVSRVALPAGKEGSTPQYLVSAEVTRSGLSEPLASPRVQTQQGVPAAVTSGTAEGMKVALRVTVSTPEEIQYEVEITEPGRPIERHRASIALPPHE